MYVTLKRGKYDKNQQFRKFKIKEEKGMKEDGELSKYNQELIK